MEWSLKYYQREIKKRAGYSLKINFCRIFILSILLVSPLILSLTSYSSSKMDFQLRKTIQVGVEITRATLLSPELVVVTLSKEGLLTIINLRDDSRKSFRSEAGITKPFKPTLIFSGGDRIIIYDAYEDIVHEFTTDGNSVRKASIAREKLSQDVKNSAVTGIVQNRREGTLIILLEEGSLISQSWKGELVWQFPLGRRHTTSLKSIIYGEKIFLYALAPLDQRLIIVSLHADGTNSPSIPKVVSELTLDSPFKQYQYPTDFLPLKSGKILLSYGNEIRMIEKTADKTESALMSLPANLSNAGKILFDSLESKILIYSQSGEMAITELK